MSHPALNLLAGSAAALALGGILLCGCDAGAGANIAEARSPMLNAPLPAIARQPHSLLVKEGEPAMFTVGSSGTEAGAAALTYQWLRNGVDIPGANQSHLLLKSITLGDDGARYTVVVSNDAGSTVSRPGVLAVVGRHTELPWR